MFFGIRKNTLPLTEEIIRKEFAYKLWRDAGGELRHYDNRIVVAMKPASNHKIRLRITDGETSVSVGFGELCLSWPLDDFSDHILAPLVPKFLPDDREFAIESLAYAT